MIDGNGYQKGDHCRAKQGKNGKREIKNKMTNNMAFGKERRLGVIGGGL